MNVDSITFVKKIRDELRPYLNILCTFAWLCETPGHAWIVCGAGDQTEVRYKQGTCLVPLPNNISRTKNTVLTLKERDD